MSEDLIRMEHIDKFYGRVQALDDVNFNVTRQEIVGLLGDNGAGKSTLIKVLSGAVRATSGDIIVRGKRVDIRSTTDAIALGIETIYQDSALVTQLSIARNLFLGREPLKGPRFLNRMDAKLMEQVAGELLRKVGIGKSIPASTPISSLSGGERQAVAIARAMHFDSDLIILDEPTNNLGVAETQGVLRFVRNARDSGHSCILIAHNIHHVFQVVDRIAVMRHGKIVADDIDPKHTTVAEVEAVITGELAGFHALIDLARPTRRWPNARSRGFVVTQRRKFVSIVRLHRKRGKQWASAATHRNGEMPETKSSFHHLLGPGFPTRNLCQRQDDLPGGRSWRRVLRCRARTGGDQERRPSFRDPRGRRHFRRDGADRRQPAQRHGRRFDRRDVGADQGKSVSLPGPKHPVFRAERHARPRAPIAPPEQSGLSGAFLSQRWRVGLDDDLNRLAALRRLDDAH